MSNTTAEAADVELIAPGYRRSGEYVFLDGDAAILVICPRGFNNEITVLPVLPRYENAAKAMVESYDAKTNGSATITTLREIHGTLAYRHAVDFSGTKLHDLELFSEEMLGDF